ncbi:MAG: hypothetical protein KAY37_06030 [Phycisphaerae bacterium]|nr:hypothetical protein [Phycisphaerae bacterium]
MNTRKAAFGILLVLAMSTAAAQAQGKGNGYRAHSGGPPAVEASALTTMPVKELAIFKDGHAFVLHESELPTDAVGDVVLDTLPTPVIGTFWPYSADGGAKLKAVVAGRRKVKSERTALSIRELLEANPGAEVLITEHGGEAYDATVVGIPKSKPEDEAEERTGPNSQGERPQRAQPGVPSDVIILKVHGGVKVVPLSRIQDVTFRAEPRAVLATEESRKLLTLKLDWGERDPGQTAKVGMVYLQRGFRWIPSYRIDIDGAGLAHVRLQATLINELVDIDGATAHLVIGVPSFYFRDTLDPMALQEAAVQLSQSFQRQGRMPYAFSNALQTQIAQMGNYNYPRGAQPEAAEVADPAITVGSRNEDLFIFTVDNVVLRKGERMVVPVVEFTLPYEDVYGLDIAFTPPAEVRSNFNNRQAEELARLMRAPKVMHRIRLENKSPYPLTTAPAIILRDGHLLAQSLMTYTALGAQTDLDLTPAVDVRVSKSDVETKRTPNAEKWDHETYGRVDLAGKISLTNHRPERVKLEVTRHVLGAVAGADHDGVIEKANVFEDSRASSHGDYPHWWHWYDWPYWWYRFNGIGRITWIFELEAGASIDLNYTWYYYWR